MNNLNNPILNALKAFAFQNHKVYIRAQWFLYWGRRRPTECILQAVGLLTVIGKTTET